MTEDEWRAGGDLGAALRHLRGVASGRKLRLFACACCRLVGHALGEPEYREALCAAERSAEADVSAPDLLGACRAASARLARARSDGRYAHSAAVAVALPDVIQAAGRTTTCVLRHFELADPAGHGAKRELVRHYCREVFGNPFRPVAFDPDWLTPTATALARGMYASGDFSAMPILADALQDAGCDNDEVLNHCRGPGPHVRGCWVIDLVLGKA